MEQESAETMHNTIGTQILTILDFSITFLKYKSSTHLILENYYKMLLHQCGVKSRKCYYLRQLFTLDYYFFYQCKLLS